MAQNKEVDEAFLREVDDELRRDQLAGWWRRWGRWLVVLVGLGLIALAAWLWWQEEQKRQAGLLGETLVQAFQSAESGNETRAIAGFSELKLSGNNAYRAAAMLGEAEMAAKQGDAKKAADAFGKVAADMNVPEAYRNLALVRQTALQFDSLKPAQVIARMKPLAIAGGPWFASAGEMTAIAYLNDNKPDLAGPLFAAIAKDKDAPASARSRAAQMAVALGIDVAPDQAAGEAGATE
ncbi:hypothetical protein BSL82_07945 [Tardibacter chloracetimidivorans]|uniref:Ancillary SecYEG translocon subunit/Cell division coordinator CpoB TPR domain-containing protein n=1 Tax=Tardibacter chloracetimidivorans TaxID=1921510 RepID=A0A1L3ZUK5_9SPHN|nr:tetratricopeptide repeat protein [Tardibacter chloracetimidivorans]API59249.1 hypothetical protein BSL82_07945 [Tardibacter chloracetimidivorans]